MMKARYAIMLDGGFVTKKLQSQLKRAATADDVEQLCARLRGIPHVADHELLRIYFYDASPSKDGVKLPVSRTQLNLGATPRASHAQSLHDQLVLKPYVALRLGEINLRPATWRLKDSATRQLIKAPKRLTDADFELNIEQKGVDLRIGLDMARLALRELVRVIIVVTGDSDFVPAFKFVRREGVQVILEPMGNRTKPELKAHSDVVL